MLTEGQIIGHDQVEKPQRKVCVVITARPSYARVRSVLEVLSARPDVKLQIVTTAAALLQRYGDVSCRIDVEFGVAAQLDTVLEGGQPIHMVKTTGLTMVELASTFKTLRPDVVVTIADRYETLATAAAAAYMNIPLAHIQGGEVTGSIDDKVRNAVTQLADIHFVSTPDAAERVRKTLPGRKEAYLRGLRPYDRVYITGCPSIDLVARSSHHCIKIADFPALKGGTGYDLDFSRPYIIVLQHPVTDEHDRAFQQAQETATAVEQSGMQAVWFWPNVDAGADGTSKAIRMFRDHSPQVHFHRGLSPEDFLTLSYGAACIVGNSSFGIREASYIGLPAINIGDRQRGREQAGNVINVPHDSGAILHAISSYAGTRYPSSKLYGDGRAGFRIASLLAELEL